MVFRNYNSYRSGKNSVTALHIKLSDYYATLYYLNQCQRKIILAWLTVLSTVNFHVLPGKKSLSKSEWLKKTTCFSDYIFVILFEFSLKNNSITVKCKLCPGQNNIPMATTWQKQALKDTHKQNKPVLFYHLSK